LCDDDVILLRDQAFDVGNLLLGFELAVGVACIRDVLAFRGFVFELGAGEMPPVIATPTIRIRDLDRPGPAEFGHRLKIRSDALFVRI